VKSPAPSIAIVGMACVYPDARNPVELWENALAQRRAFRRIPAERLRAEDYVSQDFAAPDRTYAGEAAVISNYEFDRVAFRVAGSTYRSADLAHWLALDVASRALADAGYGEGKGLPAETTGVLLGNTLTGEFSRANVLRLRWPYVRRVLEAALVKEDWAPERRREFLQRLEEEYKAPFPPVGEETLAGGLSNTIAGRICNHFNLKGGGYTVDGACASSLLAVANACSALTSEDLDLALAGGVDLSLDPFEIVGFAKTGALAPDEMRVFDARSSGFWPGEGCGLVALMRQEDALAQGRRVYAVIRGWGISSDGSGGITRPEGDGQLEALRRAYRRAGFGPDSVAYFECHGTGTAVGDATELETLSRARRETSADVPPAAVGSIKANIGHTKAAAGVAGLIKAVMSVHTQVLPPTTGCEQPHPCLGGPAPALRLLREAERWPREKRDGFWRHQFSPGPREPRLGAPRDTHAARTAFVAVSPGRRAVPVERRNSGRPGRED
jgi:enediyne polyketide synthase